VLVILAATLLTALLPVSFVVNRLIYAVPGDPPWIVAVTIWPLSPIRYAVGLLLGPVAGLAVGLGSQLLDVILLSSDVPSNLTWIAAGGLGGFLAGVFARMVPVGWRAGSRRLIGAAVIGLAASLIAYLVVFLDVYVRPGGSLPLSVGQYLTLVLPNGIFAAAVLPLVVVVAEALPWTRRLMGGDPSSGEQPRPRARPSWPAFALLTVGIILLPALSLGPTGARVVGAPAAAGPDPAPGPTGGATVREAELVLGDETAIDASCLSEGDVRSEIGSTTLFDVDLLNDTGRELAISWLDYEGHRQGLDPVSSDGGHGRWGAGHVFVLARPDGTCIVIFKVVGTTPIAIHLRS
jgi:hypothetical protein